MFLKALNVPTPGTDIPNSDLVCRPSPAGLIDPATRAAEDPHLDLAVELLIRRGPFSNADAAEVVRRVRRARALAAWRGVAA